MARALVSTKLENLKKLAEFVKNLPETSPEIDLDPEIDYLDMIISKSDLTKLTEPLYSLLKTNPTNHYGLPECQVLQ